eukprot:SAG31_NODE_35_length_31836_cov_10.841352_13_plen_111_part_00
MYRQDGIPVNDGTGAGHNSNKNEGIPSYRTEFMIGYVLLNLNLEIRAACRSVLLYKEMCYRTVCVLILIILCTAVVPYVLLGQLYLVPGYGGAGGTAVYQYMYWRNSGKI